MTGSQENEDALLNFLVVVLILLQFNSESQSDKSSLVFSY